MINPNTPNQIAAEYEARLATLRQQLAEAQQENINKALEIDRLERENEEAQRDAARYQWLKDGGIYRWFDSTSFVSLATLDEAIDAMRGEGE